MGQLVGAWGCPVCAAPPRRRCRSLLPAAAAAARCLQALLLLWFVVEDHDTLFILSESVHFLGIGLLAYKLIKKRAAGGACRAWLRW